MKIMLRAALLAAFFGSAALAQAQTALAPAPAAYVGPRYPGGPDSLRALVYRSTRLATPAPEGRMLVRFELKDGQHPHDFKLLPAPAPLNLALINASATALNYLEAQMPAWQAGLPDPDATENTKRDVQCSLLLDFTADQTTQPYAYADQNPVFAQPLAKARKQIISSTPTLDSSPQGMTRLMQTQVKYPRAALVHEEEGTVYAYFEVAENGAIEHSEILGTATPALDAEVLRLVKKLPAATTPPQLRGRPVRVFYILPVTFKIQ